MAPNTTPDKILIVAQNWLGDALFSTPAIRAVAKAYPKARLAVLTPQRAAAVFERNPFVNEVIYYDERASLFSLSFWKTVFFLRRRRFDAALFFHRSRTKVRMAMFAGIPQRWGYRGRGKNKILTKSVETPVGPCHRIDYFLGLVQKLGIPADGRFMDFVPDARAGAQLDALFAECGLSAGAPYAVVHCGGNWSLKRWSTEYFAQWIYFVQEQYGWPVILCGTDSEKMLTEKIIKRFAVKPVYSFCGKTNLDALALLLRGARFFLSNDSGPIHLAASQKTTLLGLYGPTLPEETGPVSAGDAQVMRLDVGCQVPCYFKHCDYRLCLDWLRPSQVFDKTRQMLSSHED